MSEIGHTFSNLFEWNRESMGESVYKVRTRHDLVQHNLSIGNVTQLVSKKSETEFNSPLAILVLL